MFKFSTNLIRLFRADINLTKNCSSFQQQSSNSYLAEITYKNSNYQSPPVLANEVNINNLKESISYFSNLLSRIRF